MSYQNLAAAIVIMLTLIGCAPTERPYGDYTPMDQLIKSARNMPNCYYESIVGEEIKFNPYHAKTYIDFHFDYITFNPNHPEVEKYKNLRAKIKPELLVGQGSHSYKSSYEVVVENCDILYIPDNMMKDIKDPLKYHPEYTLTSKLDDDKKKLVKYKYLQEPIFGWELELKQNFAQN